jgi:hypothetical protein
MEQYAFVVDRHIKAVLVFMQENLPASKLLRIAEELPQWAQLLWARYPKQELSGLTLTLLKSAGQSLSTANESDLGPQNVGDDSAVEVDVSS